VTSYAGTGDIDVIPVFFGLNEFLVVEFGLDWPAAWGSMDYTRCAGDIAIGTILVPGDGMAIAWTCCQYTWSVAPGIGWLSATGSGTVSLVPCPMTGDYGVVDCAPPETRAYDYPAAVFGAGVGGADGGDPCQTVYLPLTLTKDDGRGGDCVSPDSSIVYNITYSNANNSADVHNVMLTDSLPSGVAFAAASGGGIYDAGAHTLTWALGSLAGGDVGSVEVTGSVIAEPGETLTNACRITSDEAPGDQAGTATLVCSGAYLSLNLDKADGLADGGCVTSGGTLTYTIDFDNSTNTYPVTGVVLVDYLPAQTAFISSTGGGVYNGATRRVTWQIGTLGAGAAGSRTLTLRVNAPGSSSITNICEISSSETPMSQATRHTSTCPESAPLSLTKSDGLGGQCIYSGDTLTYTLAYENTMINTAAHNVTLTDSLPDESEFVAASAGGAYDGFSRTVTWMIGSLAPGQSGTRTLDARITSPMGSVITNTCRIASDQTPVTRTTKATTVCGTIYRPLGLAKTAAAGSCVDNGDTVTYTISYDNTANQIEVHNAILTDYLPGWTDFVGASPGGVFDGASRVTWDLGTLEAGASGSQQVTVAVHVAQGQTFTNQCSLSSSEAPTSEASRSLQTCGASTRNSINKIAVHLKAHPTSCTKNYPAFANCGMMNTTYPGCGDVDAMPVFYDLAEITVVEFGLIWPAEWGTCSFTRCKGTIAVGGIELPGDGIAVAWSQCQYDWAIAPGVAWFVAGGPGLVTPIANPATGDMGVVNCAPSPGPYYDYPMAIAAGGVCGEIGPDPCYPTKLQPATWGSIKAMFK
jgi:uncharacterized repeat protein (TIGR01451 family)